MLRRKLQRLPTFDYIGPHRYFLTFCTERRCSHFLDDKNVTLVLSEILHRCQAERFAVVAYCFMPDHLHLLIEGLHDSADGARMIALLKQCTGYRWSQNHRTKLWQRYGYERVLRTDEDTASVVRYIIENPVRAGLVAAPERFPFSGSAVFSMTDVLDAAMWTPVRPAKAGPFDKST